MTADRLPDEVMKEIEREEMAATQTADLARLRLHVRKLARIAREEHADNARLREALMAIRDGEFDDLDIDDGMHTVSARERARAALRGGEAKDGE